MFCVGPCQTSAVMTMCYLFSFLHLFLRMSQVYVRKRAYNRQSHALTATRLLADVPPAHPIFPAAMRLFSLPRPPTIFVASVSEKVIPRRESTVIISTGLIVALSMLANFLPMGRLYSIGRIFARFFLPGRA